MWTCPGPRGKWTMESLPIASGSHAALACFERCVRGGATPVTSSNPASLHLRQTELVNACASGIRP